MPQQQQKWGNRRKGGKEHTRSGRQAVILRIKGIKASQIKRLTFQEL